MQMLLSDDAEDAYLGRSPDAAEYWQGFLPYFVLHVPEMFYAGALLCDEGCAGLWIDWQRLCA